LLSKLHPIEVAKRTGRTIPGVLAKRWKLRLPDMRTTAERVKAGRSVWSPQADDVVRKHKPLEAAKLLGIGETTVRERRRKLGLPGKVKYRQPPKPRVKPPVWTDAEYQVVRTKTLDQAAAKLPQRSRMAIIYKRWKLKKEGVKLR
jgi:hypothetical protein